MTLLALYLGTFILGGILIGASIVGFSKDADGHALAHDKDFALDHDHDHDHGAVDKPGGVLEGGATFMAATLLSVRFWTFALASFGLTGLLLTLLGVPAIVGLVTSTFTGLGIGVGVSTAMRQLTRGTVSSAVGTSQLGGRDAEVVLSVGPGKTGKVRFHHQGQIVELPATTRETRIIERGERVLVVEVVDGTADVTPAEPDRKVAAQALSTPE